MRLLCSAKHQQMSRHWGRTLPRDDGISADTLFAYAPNHSAGDMVESPSPLERTPAQIIQPFQGVFTLQQHRTQATMQISSEQLLLIKVVVEGQHTSRYFGSHFGHNSRGLTTGRRTLNH